MVLDLSPAFIKFYLKIDKKVKVLNVDKLGYASNLARLKQISSNLIIVLKINLCNKKVLEDVINQFKPFHSTLCCRISCR